MTQVAGCDATARHPAAGLLEKPRCMTASQFMMSTEPQPAMMRALAKAKAAVMTDCSTGSSTPHVTGEAAAKPTEPNSGCMSAETAWAVPRRPTKYHHAPVAAVSSTAGTQAPAPASPTTKAP